MSINTGVVEQADIAKQQLDPDMDNEKLLGNKNDKKKSKGKNTVSSTYGTTVVKKKLDFFDEILSIEYMKGFRRSIIGNMIFWTIVVCTAGLALLVFNWFEKGELRLRNKRCELEDADKVWIKSADAKYELCKVTWLDTVTPRQKMIVYRHTRFYWIEATKSFERLQFNAEKKLSELHNLVRNGISSPERHHALQMYGPNVIDFPVPSIPKLLLQEVIHPFFVFQIYSVVLWCFENYYYYAAAILFIALASIALTLKETRGNLLNLQKIARFECDVNLLRDGTFHHVSSADLVPGDIIEISQRLVMPCDVVCLQGQAVMNESMLTGESIPVIKVPMSLEGNPDDTHVVGSDPRTIAFGGTHVLKLQPNAPGEKVLGMVLKCGFETSKGALILSILFPKPSHFKFFRESLKFLGVLCIIGVSGFGVSVYRLLSVGEKVSEVLVKALDLITIVVPPALPMAMTVGTGFALIRLKRNNIYCVSPQRINMAGKIEVFCFDKTGTLTEDGLDLLGIHPASQGRFDGFTADMTSLNTELLYTMATCHTLTTVDEELIGDPLELKMFQATRAQVHDGKTEGYSATVQLPRTSTDDYHMVGNDIEIGLLERFEFQSSLQRMSVIVQEIGKQNNIQVFVKGSPEMISSLSIPSTVPKDFAEKLMHYTNKGYRVLACGHRTYDGPLKGIRKDLLRKQVESDLVFLGFIVMENKVKKETPKTLTVLKEARIRCIMVTGDNVLTAVSVARECGLIDPNITVFMGDKEVDPTTGEDRIQFVDVTSEGTKLNLDINTLALEVNGRSYVGANYALAVTGKVWEALFLEFTSGKKHRFLKMLEKGAVFARMTPDQKAALIEELQHLGLYVAMCGDGANDCGALKAAHVGISLSEAEASIAAPFTSTRPNITCTPTLIKEGRASLAVSFKLFQFMGMYSMIQFMCVILLYFESSLLGNWQYLYQDLWTVFPLVIFMGKTTPCNKLAKKRPSGRLVSGAVVGSLLTHVAVCGLFQLAIFFLIKRQPWYIPGTLKPDHDPQNIYIYEMTALFTYSNFQYLIMAFIYSWGKPFLNTMYTNVLLFGTWLLLLTTSSLILFLPTPNVWDFAQLVIMPWRWRIEMLILVVANFVLCALVETIIYGIKHRLKLRQKNKTTFQA